MTEVNGATYSADQSLLFLEAQSLVKILQLSFQLDLLLIYQTQFLMQKYDL